MTFFMKIGHIRALFVGKGGFRLIHPFVSLPRLDKSVMIRFTRCYFEYFEFFRRYTVSLSDVHNFLFISVFAVFRYDFSYFTSLS